MMDQPHLLAGLVNRPLPLLFLAAVCLIVALRFAGGAMRPIGAIIQSVAAAAVVVLAVGVALLLVVAVAVAS